MKTVLRCLSVMLALALVLPGCAKRATPEDCKKLCTHVTQLTMATIGDPLKMAEDIYKKSEESAKGMVESSKADVAKILKEMDDGFASASAAVTDPAALEKMKADHEKAKADMKVKLDEAVKGAEDMLKKTQADWEKQKKEIADQMKADLDKGVAECAKSCEKERPKLDQVKCVLDAKKLEDLAKCDKK
jgi:F0F1-type ATP synthase membrane subunit b/b'